MKPTIQVVFHGMEASEAVEAAARKKAEHLGQDYYCDRGNLASGRFEQLQLGQPVRFTGEMAGERLQAKRVSIGKPLVGLEVP